MKLHATPGAKVLLAWQLCCVASSDLILHECQQGESFSFFESVKSLGVAASDPFIGSSVSLV